MSRATVKTHLSHVFAKLDVANMPYVGRVVTNIDTGVALPKSGIKSFDDVRAKPYTVEPYRS